MIRSIVRAVSLGAAALGAMCVSQAASATAFTFAFTDTSSAGPGSAIDYYTTENGPTKTGNPSNSSQLGLDVWGGHITNLGSSGQSSVSGATVTSYGGAGLGVLFDKDNTGDGTHQMDNVGGGADFVALVFNQDVTLSSIVRKNYSYEYSRPVTGSDTDASFMAYSGSIYDLASNGVNLGGFSTLLDANTDTNSSKSSKIWLVSAYTASTMKDDAFKLKSVTVNTADCSPTPAVPEPATWAMMLVGFGVIGMGLRQRKATRPSLV